MSVEAIALVLNHSKLSGTNKLVLIGIANHEGDGGAWPAVETLARYANCSVRQARRAVLAACEAGECRVINRGAQREGIGGGHQTNSYRITLACPPECDGTSQHRMKRPRTAVRTPVSAQDPAPVRTPVTAQPVRSPVSAQEGGDRSSTVDVTGHRCPPNRPLEPSTTEAKASAAAVAAEPASGEVVALFDPPSASSAIAIPEQGGTTAADIVREWVDGHPRDRITKRNRGQLASESKVLLDAGFTAREIWYGAVAWRQNGYTGKIETFVRRATDGISAHRPSTTTAAVNQGLALVERYAAEEGHSAQ